MEALLAAIDPMAVTGQHQLVRTNTPPSGPIVPLVSQELPIPAVPEGPTSIGQIGPPPIPTPMPSAVPMNRRWLFAFLAGVVLLCGITVFVLLLDDEERAAPPTPPTARTARRPPPSPQPRARAAGPQPAPRLSKVARPAPPPTAAPAPQAPAASPAPAPPAPAPPAPAPPATAPPETAPPAAQDKPPPADTPNALPRSQPAATGPRSLLRSTDPRQIQRLMTRGTLEILTSSDSAKVFVNGRINGQGRRVVLRRLPAGTYRVQVEVNGVKTPHRDVELRPNQELRLSF
jgi:hypothetical protein